MKRLIIAPVAVFGLLLVVVCAPHAQAQIQGVPTSVTSTGFGGHFDKFPGVRTSVTATGPQAVTAGDHAFHPGSQNPGSQNPGSQNCCINPLFPLNPNPPRGPHEGPHHPRRGVSGAIYVPYPLYYTEPAGDESASMEDTAQPAEPADYAPGPTIFDRRGSIQSSVAAEAAYADRQRQAATQEEPAPQPAAAPAEAAPVPEQPWTILMFKDGHQMEVQNYAIVGDMLYDMTPGRRNKVAIAELDLSATAKANDERGVDFQLPVRPVAN